MTLECGAGPLLRAEGDRQHVEGGALECGAPESGGRAHSGGVWAGLGPSALEGVSEGVSECRGGAWALRSRREAGRAED